MKKALSLLLALVMCLSLCACSGSNSKSCTVTFSDGTSKTLSPRELSDICTKDAVSWKNYIGAQISGSGKITQIEEGCSNFYDVPVSSTKNGVETKYKYYQVTIDQLVIVLTRAEVFSGMAVGDTVRYDGEINSGSGVVIRVDFGDDTTDNPQQHIFPG